MTAPERRGSIGLATLAGRALAAIVGGLVFGLLFLAAVAQGAPPPG